MPAVFSTLEIRTECHLSLSRLVHLLLRNPRYTNAVRRVVLYEGELAEDFSFPFEWVLLADAVRPLSPENDDLDDWMRSLQGRTSGLPDLEWSISWQALLLSIVQNLKVLKFVAYHGSSHLDWLVERLSHGLDSFDGHPVFTRVQEVFISEHDLEWEPIELHDIVPLLNLPLLRRFHCSGLLDNWYRDAKPFSFPNIRHLSFISSNSGNGFKKVVAGCKALQTFEYQHSHQPELGDDFNVPALYPSLSKQKKTLEDLTVYNLHDYTGESPENAFLGALKDFTALRKLRIRADNLLDWSGAIGPSFAGTIPSSLKSLIIEYFDLYPRPLRFVDQIEDFARNRTPEDSQLESLQIRGDFMEQSRPDLSRQTPGRHFLDMKMQNVGLLLDNALGSSFSMRDYRLDTQLGWKTIPREWYSTSMN